MNFLKNNFLIFLMLSGLVFGAFEIRKSKPSENYSISLLDTNVEKQLISYQNSINAKEDVEVQKKTEAGIKEPLALRDIASNINNLTRSKVEIDLIRLQGRVDGIIALFEAALKTVNDQTRQIDALNTTKKQEKDKLPMREWLMTGSTLVITSVGKSIYDAYQKKASIYLKLFALFLSVGVYCLTIFSSGLF